MTELRPLLAIVLNVFASFLVAHGFLSPVDSGNFVSQAADVAGLGILFATSLYSLRRYVHLHPVAGQVTQTTKTEVTVPVAPAPVEVPVAPLVAAVEPLATSVEPTI